ncbi:IS1/IS1595 family N-terminal zinc-binding domain-containing protein [Spirosoma pollinicola]
MVFEAVSCKHCGQTQHVKRYGTTRAGTQRYQCFDYGRIAPAPRPQSNLYPQGPGPPDQRADHRCV